MIDAKRLLADLKRQRKRLHDDLRQHHADSPGRARVHGEWQAALKARRTADSFETFWTAALDQAAVHWLLALVFLRFLEDNRLFDRPVLAGVEERGEVAAERQRKHFRANPHDSDAEYLVHTLADAAALPGLSGLFDPAHNPLFRLPVSGDGAMALLAFWRERTAEGGLVHDFTDPDWDTRFLGDFYQDLSEDARKRYALLQTPAFVESWILDRTLDPAIREFGWDRVRMIDPACGSGHFLLGGFARLLDLGQRHDPSLNPAAQAQRALDAVAGVDLNPLAVEITRFRLLLAALRAAGETRLAAAPDFRFHLAVGDSLLHGTHHFRGELGGADAGFDRRQRNHVYAAEDVGALNAILGRHRYHAVVGNPPYITPKDPAMREAYREVYASCHMKYGLGVPFIERFFDLAQTGTADQAAGFVGLIVANSFMKREFGAKLIEAVLPRLDLTHVVDCSGAYIPGHGTPTAILFGRNRPPVGGLVRTVRGIRGEPGAPDDPARGLVWSAIVAQTDMNGSTSEFISTEDTPRAVLARHPWNMGGGGAAELQETIVSNKQSLTQYADIGVMAITGEDDAYVRSNPMEFERNGLKSDLRPFVEGDRVRDWCITNPLWAYFPYDVDGQSHNSVSGTNFLWRFRALLTSGIYFGRTKAQRGMSWQEYAILVKGKADNRPAITFGYVATHNHFVLDRSGKIFKQTAPIIKLPVGASEDAHFGLLGLLNSSTACFWLKQVGQNRGSTVDDRGARQRTLPFEDFYEFTPTMLGNFPLAANPPLDLARALDTQAERLSHNLPAALCARATPTADALAAARAEAEAARATMIALQEELDWRCYRLYGLLDDAPEHPAPPPLCLGERAFEIVLARRMAAGTLDTAWFTRHRSTPITELPAHWPGDYRAAVERRIALIETDPGIGLIERPEYKRRWAAPPWEEQERDALRAWLLDRLEAPRFWPADEPAVLSTRDLADLVRRDSAFVQVAALYAGATADLDALVAELVAREAVPFLAPLRYSETGSRKRAEWEATWDKQRAEDAIDRALADERGTYLRAAWAKTHPRPEGESADAYAARMAAGLGDPAVAREADAAIAKEAKRRKAEEVGPISVPPKYRTPDFVHADYWRLRGGLDVPKERFVSFPHCARDADGTLPVLWAGHDGLARAAALASWYVERKDVEGWPAARLAPMLAGLLEQVPWLRQWHNDPDRETGLRMGDYYADFVADEARSLGLTLDDLRAWRPPAPARRARGRAAAATAPAQGDLV